MDKESDRATYTVRVKMADEMIPEVFSQFSQNGWDRVTVYVSGYRIAN